jgi:hypothetical protein
MNRAQHRQQIRERERAARRRSTTTGEPFDLDLPFMIQTDPGCDSPEHRELIQELMMSALMDDFDDGCGVPALLVEGHAIRWSCGCMFSLEFPPGSEAT